MTAWCNYSCSYCGVPVYLKRDKERHGHEHAFDNHTVEEWLQALDRFPQKRVYLQILGGEVFLDQVNWRKMLEGLARNPKFDVVVLTNGSWDADQYKGLDHARLTLTVTYHPLETALDPFVARLHKMREAGFRVRAVFLVLAPENLDFIEPAIWRFEQEGFLTHAFPMIRSGAYTDLPCRQEREIDMVIRYCNLYDAYYKIVDPPTRGKLCFYPAIAYNLNSNGKVAIACTGPSADLFTEDPPPLIRQAQPCPKDHCFNCLAPALAIKDQPMLKEPRFVTSGDEYIDMMFDGRNPRSWPEPERMERRNWVDPAAFPALEQALRGTLAKPGQPTLLVKAQEIKAALPPMPVFGFIDMLNGTNTIHALGRDRIHISGWAASQQGAPVKEVRLLVGEQLIHSFQYFYPRPEVVDYFGRENLLNSGWRSLVYIPSLPKGEYLLRAVVVGTNGETGELPAFHLRIAG